MALLNLEPTTDVLDALALGGSDSFPGPSPLRPDCLAAGRPTRTAAASPPLELLRPARLITAHAAVLLAPPIARDLADPELPDRFCHRHALAMQDFRRRQHSLPTISSGL